MKFLKHIRSRSKAHNGAQVYNLSGYPAEKASHGHPSPLVARLPLAVLENIFTHVCPHALDQSFESSEDSMVEDGCMLCDMRDLAHCALVCRRWSGVARTAL